MKQSAEKFLQYLSSVKNSSPHTILNYGKDLSQFLEFLSPPGAQPPALKEITHTIIREFVFQVLRARGIAGRESGSACTDAKTTEANSVGVVGGRNERLPEWLGRCEARKAGGSWQWAHHNRSERDSSDRRRKGQETEPQERPIVREARSRAARAALCCGTAR